MRVGALQPHIDGYHESVAASLRQLGAAPALDATEKGIATAYFWQSQPCNQAAAAIVGHRALQAVCEAQRKLA